MKKIAVMTSGGDAPGMNAALRAVVRQSIFSKINVVAVHNGFEGLIDGNFQPMEASSVSNIIQKGGTILKTSRSERFLLDEFRQVAYDKLKQAEVEAVVAIGGNGSIKGAQVFTDQFDIPFIAVPKTIDNDVSATDWAIGFDTACNTAMEAIDKIRDTADAHHRLFFVEVMGRNLGYIALHAGICGGAEAILIPEMKEGVDELIEQLKNGWKRQKSSLIVIVAEGCVKNGLHQLVSKVQEHFSHYEIKTSVLGHIQRGGSPSAFDRVLATRLGSAAITGLLTGVKNSVVGLIGNDIKFTPLSESASVHKLDKELYRIALQVSC